MIDKTILPIQMAFLVVGLLFAACAPYQPEDVVSETVEVEREVTVELRRLGTPELAQTAHFLRSRPDTIRVMAYQYDPKAEANTFLRETRLRGYLIGRPLAVSPLENSFYTDGQFNLIAFFPVESQTGRRR